MLTKVNAIKNLDQIITNIEFARLQVNGHHIVQLVAVSKYNTIEDIQNLYNAGQRAFGENKIQDFKIKSLVLDELPIPWHFIGTLQKNKINNLIDLKPFLFHSLDSYELALLLDEKLKIKSRTMNCLLQINSAKEDSKAGVMADEAVDVYNKILANCSSIKLKGVMSIGAHSENRNEVKDSFLITKAIFDQCEGAKTCSMGMSSDYELAISCGSNMLRVGSSLFKEN
jgi:pyridoxal phosphate enzyme (YggS family)